MPPAAKTTVKIRILPNRSVLIDGADRTAGEELDVSQADAETLAMEGYAEVVIDQGDV